MKLKKKNRAENGAKNPLLWFVGSAFVAIGIFSFIYTYKFPQLSTEVQTQGAVELPMIHLEEAYPYAIAPRTTLFSALREIDVPSAIIQKIVDAAKPIQDLAKLKPGIRFQLFYANENNSDLVGIQFRFSAIEFIDIRRVNETWTAEKMTEKVDLKIVTFSGIVRSSLWESALKAKMDPNLISELADIFGWEVDFSREVRLNDRWRLTVEQKMVKGEPIGWGAILAAEYENEGNSYQAVLFRQNGEEMGYFTPEGKSLRKMFLKSPIRYGRITSGFATKRFHPILLTNRAHLGVDYGAPIGTPIRAVGDGVVTFADWSGGGGRVLKIRHNSTYQTAYKHLNGFAKGVHPGAKVQQGQVIAYVGNTGLSTGPHLHFEFYQGGRFVDPLGKKFPSADPVPADYLAQFKAEAADKLNLLPVWQSVEQASLRISGK
jgi:murein DD-endopeptidase MepM/ murein hydrolase activator NlpD